MKKIPHLKLLPFLFHDLTHVLQKILNAWHIHVHKNSAMIFKSVRKKCWKVNNKS